MSPAIAVNFDGDHEGFADRLRLWDSRIIHTTQDWAIDALDHGMASGATSLMVVIPVEVDGQRCAVMAQTSLACFMQAATVLAASHEHEVTKPGWAVLSPAARALLFPRMAEAFRRAIPQATAEQIKAAAEMVLDGFGADAPTS